MKNNYAKRRMDRDQGFLDVGMDTGFQKCWDLIQVALRDPEFMGKDIFGKDRLLKVVKAVDAYIDKYELAWKKDDETDYYRAKLDDALAEAYGEALHNSFLERYEYAPEYDYKKGKWK